MKIGILIASALELGAFLENGSEITETLVGRRTLYHTKMYGHDIYAVQSGCGVVDAASGTQMLISAFGCELIMNFGVAGALIPELKVEELFLVKRTIHHDYDVSTFEDVKPHQYPENEDEYIPLDEELVSLVKEIMPEIRLVTVASGDHFVEDREEKKSLASLDCEIVDMEIASIARTCFMNKVRCVSIKCISDTFEGNSGDYLKNVDRGSKTAFKVILEILQKL